MTRKHLGFSLLFFPIFLFLLHHSQAQPLPNITGYPCSSNRSIYPCKTYAFYRAMAPDLLDLSTIADLFSVSRPMISKPSNLSSTTSPLIPDQSLFVPLTCSCDSNTSLSYANLSYTILKGDTFYQVSTHQFQNLTTYQSVEVVNPSLIATNLTIGVEAIFPIFCKCLNETQLQNGTNYLISYVFQPSDNLSSIASKFGSNLQSLIDINGENLTIFDTVFVPVSEIPPLTQPPALPPLSSGKEDRKGVIVGLSIGLGVSGFLLILLILIMGIWVYREVFLRSKEREKDMERVLVRREKASNKEEESLMADVSDCLDKYRVFGIQEIREATSGFDSSSLIQGSVYKGFIGGEIYAIKKMKWNAWEELKILQKVNHGNLVKLEGFCIDPEDGDCYLVYEFVENGSLYSWLHGNNTAKKLDWKTRLRIAIDISNGLQYIHEHTRPRVVHKDIKTSNILLDGNMRAKIANFGLAKSGCNAITMHIVGTQGYIAPEYLADGIITTKLDVFAFGVVLLELISGKEAINEEGRVLWGNVDRVLEGREEERIERVKEWMDEDLVKESCSIDSVASVMAIAVGCLQKDPSKRPSMVEIVYTLCKSDDLYYDYSEEGLSVSPLTAR